LKENKEDESTKCNQHAAEDKSEIRERTNGQEETRNYIYNEDKQVVLRVMFLTDVGLQEFNKKINFFNLFELCALLLTEAFNALRNNLYTLFT
jgi:hypothetical protein